MYEIPPGVGGGGLLAAHGLYFCVICSNCQINILVMWGQFDVLNHYGTVVKKSCLKENAVIENRCTVSVQNVLHNINLERIGKMETIEYDFCLFLHIPT